MTWKPNAGQLVLKSFVMQLQLCEALHWPHSAVVSPGAGWQVASTPTCEQLMPLIILVWCQ